jgi:hypothetical protein
MFLSDFYMMLDKKLVDCFEEIEVDQDTINNNFISNDLEHKKLKENFFPPNDNNINEQDRKFTRRNKKNQYIENRNSNSRNRSEQTFKFNRKVVKER